MMAKRLKLKLSRVMPSFQFCRFNSPCNFPQNSTIPMHKSFNLPTPPPSTPEGLFARNQVGWGCQSRPCTESSIDFSSESIAPRYVLNIQTKPPPNQNIHSGNSNKTQILKRLPVTKKNQSKFSENQENKEAEAQHSTSISFSNNSSESFSQGLETTDKSGSEYDSDSDDYQYESKPNFKLKNMNKVLKLKRHVSFSKAKLARSDSQVSVLMQRKTNMEGTVGESVTVVKRSEDPYDDFMRSMLEMILEKQMFDAKELEELLRCFLSLNSTQYHNIIVEAFTEIWEILFTDDALAPKPFHPRN